MTSTYHACRNAVRSIGSHLLYTMYVSTTCEAVELGLLGFLGRSSAESRPNPLEAFVPSPFSSSLPAIIRSFFSRFLPIAAPTTLANAEEGQRESIILYRTAKSPPPFSTSLVLSRRANFSQWTGCAKCEVQTRCTVDTGGTLAGQALGQPVRARKGSI